MKKLFTLTAIVFYSITALAQAPSNDNCSGAIDLGTLPTPNTCNKGGNGQGASVTFTGLTNVNATPANPYIYMLNCQGGGDMSNPSDDVWYSFTATGNQVTINLSNYTGTFTNPSIGFWDGTCASLTGRGCANGTGANMTAVFEPTTPGQTYYIQISGSGANSQGTFDLGISNSNDCSQCNLSSEITATPLPVNGTYAVGTEVTFCYTVSDYSQVNSNWFHGVQLDFLGAGWDLTYGTNGIANPTVTPSQCSNSGTWVWYPTGVNCFDNSPGWYYLYNGSNGPCRNYGDVDVGPNCPITFCFTLRTKPLAQCDPSNPSSLEVTINTSADGESGSWTSLACVNDPPVTFSAILACCESPVTNLNQQVSCFGGNDGQATATVNSVFSPFNYQWYDVQGNLVFQTLNSGSSSNTQGGLSAGTYIVVVTDDNGCVSSSTIQVTELPGATVTVPGNYNVCNNDIVNVGNFVVSPSDATFEWISSADVGFGTNGTNQIGSFTAVNNTTEVIVAQVQVIPILNGCGGQPQIFSIVVNPSPIISMPEEVTVCPNNPVDISASFLPAPTPFELSFTDPGATALGSGPGTGTATTSVSISGITPTTLQNGQIVSACFTIKHQCFTDITWFSITVNGTTYTSTTGSPAGATYNADLAAMLATIRATPADAAVTVCFPQSFLNLLDGGATNSTWSLSVRDNASNSCGTGRAVGDIIDFTIIVLNTPTVNYAWSPTTNLSGTTSGTTTVGTLPTVTATPPATTTYTLQVTDNMSGCVGLRDVTIIISTITPQFTQLGPYCVGDTPGSLPIPTDGNGNNVTGTWSPTTITTSAASTTDYTFTPADTDCFETVVMEVVVNDPTLVPSFTQLGPYCLGATPGVLPTISNNGITGTWNATISTATANTTTYTFTPSAGQCASQTTMDVVITAPTIPAFTQLGPYCQNATPGTLPTTSNNGLTGTWNAAISTATAGTVTYTFTPTAGLCATQATMDVLVNPAHTITPGSNQTVCIDQLLSPNITLTIGGGATGANVTGLPAGVNFNVTGLTVTISGIPTEIGTFNYTVLTTGNACASVSANGTITVNSLPSATNLTPSVCADVLGGTTASGVDLTANNSSVNGNGAASFTWYQADGTTLIATPNNTTVSNGQVFIVQVTLNGCSSSATVTYTVTDNITLEDEITLCGNASGQLTGVNLATYNTTVYGGTATFQWYTDATKSATISTPSSLTINNGDQFFVVVTAGNCLNETLFTFNIATPPNAGTGNTLTVCSTDASVDLFSLLGGSPETTGTWSGPSTLAGAHLGTLEPSTASSGTYTYTVTATTPCNNATANIVVTINETPDADFNPLNSSYCLGELPLQLTAIQTGGVFSGTGVTDNGDGTGSFSVGVIANFTITYNININGCPNASSQEIEIVSSVVPTFDNLSYCFGVTTSLPSTSNNGYEGTWSPTLNTDVLGESNYTFTPDDQSCAVPVDVIVTILPLPTATITGTRSAICEGEELPDLIISFTGEGPWTYNLNGIEATTSDNPLVFTSPANGGTFTVTTVTDVNCTNTGNNSSTQVVVTTPVASFDSNPNEGAAPLEVFFTNTSNGTLFSWEFGDGNTSTAENPTNTYTALGEYIVTLTITVNGCTATATDTIIVIGGSTVDLPNVFSPDGTGTNELFKSISENMTLERFQIFNRWGQLMYEGPAWDGTHNGQKAPEGTYYYVYYGEGADGKIYEGADYTGHLTLVRGK